MNRMYAIIALVVLALVQAFMYQNLSHNFSEYKLESAVTIAESQTKALEAESKFNTNINEVKDGLQENFSKQVGRIDTAVRNLSSARLQDPGSHSKAAVTSGVTPSSNTGTQSRELSSEASQFLWSFAGDADKERESLIACKQWSTELSKAYDEYRNQMGVSPTN